MDFDYQWFLIGLPVAFVLGWLASRFDIRQWRREQHDSPQAYFKGLNLLLNEQQDKAIDAFIEAVQHDPGTSDLHFALGNLFRRRGEYDRAVRVHEHLLGRADLRAADRERAQHELAQDFFKAGLFDRAEEAYRELEGTDYTTEARLALLTLYERSRDWRAAIDMALKLERADSHTGSFAPRVSHYWCEIALDDRTQGRLDDAEASLARARDAAPHSARSLVLEGQWRLDGGDPQAAIDAWNRLLVSSPAAFNLIARDYARAALDCGPASLAACAVQVAALLERSPTSDLMVAIGVLEDSADRHTIRLTQWLQAHTSPSGASALLKLTDPPRGASEASARANAEATAQGLTIPAEALSVADEAHAAVVKTLDTTAKPLQRYRCAACGFEAAHYFWQCPGCQGWDTYPPRRLEDL